VRTGRGTNTSTCLQDTLQALGCHKHRTAHIFPTLQALGRRLSRQAASHEEGCKYVARERVPGQLLQESALKGVKLKGIDLAVLHALQSQNVHAPDLQRAPVLEDAVIQYQA